MKSVVLLGAGGHATSVISVLKLVYPDVNIRIVGTSGDVGSILCGYKIEHTDVDLTNLSKRMNDCVIGVGFINNSIVFNHLIDLAGQLNMNFPRVVSPRAYLSSDSNLGVGVQVLHQSYIGPSVSVGDHSIVNTGVIVEHGTNVGCRCHLAPGAVLLGDVNVGAGTFVGANCTVMEGVSIGPGCIIGMGLTIRKDVPAGTKVVRQ
jgi:sugar O-acyltransferase (sialic acid O-acetyltransferase NeuD family)